MLNDKIVGPELKYWALYFADFYSIFTMYFTLYLVPCNQNLICNLGPVLCITNTYVLCNINSAFCILFSVYYILYLVLHIQYPVPCTLYYAPFIVIITIISSSYSRK